MHRYQRGELNLWWCAVLVGLCTALAFAALFSMRYERNLFAEGWAMLQGTPLGQTAQHAQSAATSALNGQDAGISKCTINGAVVYSNVDCRKDNATTRAVELHDTHGFEAPKVPVVTKPAKGNTDEMQEKAIDKAVGN